MHSNNDRERARRARPTVRQRGERAGFGRRRFLTLASGAVASALLAACGGGRGTSTPQTTAPIATGAGTGVPGASPIAAATTAATGQLLVIQAVEYGFQTNGSVPAGVTTIQLKNLGTEHHETQFIRLNDGVTPAQFMTGAKQDEETALHLGTQEGGPGRITPQGTSTVLLALMPGPYVIACFVTASDGKSHASKGMVLPLMVTGAGSPATAVPMGRGTIMLGGSAFVVPAMLPAGQSMYRITNAGKEAHEFFVGRLGTGKTAADLQTALANPSDSDLPEWFEPFGGMEGMKAGGVGAVVLDLQPGSYAAVDGPAGDATPIVKGFMVAGA
jgi:hypothetical protein